LAPETKILLEGAKNQGFRVKVLLGSSQTRVVSEKNNTY